MFKKFVETATADRTVDKRHFQEEAEMWIERCSNWRCRRPYQVNEFKGEGGNLFGDELRPEEVTCPHCGRSESRWTSSIFLTHALSSDEEAHFQQTRHET